MREGGIFRILFHSGSGLDYVDPALASTAPGWAVLDTTCARLLTYPDKPPPKAYHFVPEVAEDLRRSRVTARHTRSSSAGTSVSATTRRSARARSPGLSIARSHQASTRPGSTHARHPRSRRRACGKEAHRHRRARRTATRSSFGSPAPCPTSFTARRRRSSAPCRQNSRRTLKASAPFPRAGPYYVKEYRPGERVVLRKNRYYGGKRPHHVDGFDVDLRALTPQDVVKARRPRRSRLGPHGCRDLLRSEPRARREARNQSLAILRQARLHLAHDRLQLGTSSVPGQREPA